MKVRFRLNGKETRVDAAPDRRVVDLLREDLGLTGTKEGCGSGECGACTILVNGETRLGCLMIAAQLDGQNVTTIEGMGEERTGRALQEAFIESGAVQCGFCTPGMILSAAALLERNADPDAAEIREALSGNLCRCTGYGKIVEAVAIAVDKRKREETE
jgi:carbon-monoxide dehydrogenase small subunit